MGVEMMDRELLRVFHSERLKAQNLGDEIEGDLRRIKWEELEAIGRPMAELVCRSLDISCDSIVAHDLIEVPVGGESQVSVSFTTNVVTDPESIDHQVVRQALSVFVNRIFACECASGDLFDEQDVSEKILALASRHAESFLEQRGDKRLSAPIRVSGFEFQKICSGKFSAKPKTECVDTGKQVYNAKITALSKRKQEFELLLAEGKHVVIGYEKDHFFWMLRDRLGDETYRTFTTHQKPLADGKSVPVLVQIDD